jgi:PAS domain-containing protein
MGTMAEAQKPLELILARNLLSSISTPAFLVDAEGTLVFFNEAAGALVGRRFEETGALGPREWGEAFGPIDDDGEPIPWDRIPLTLALQHGRPMHSRMNIHSATGDVHDIEVSALPIVGTEGFRGAMAIFWPVASAKQGASSGEEAAA